MRNTLRLWVIGCVAAMVALVAGGWFVGAQPLLSAASDAAQSAAEVASTNQTTQVQLAGLAKQSRDVATLNAEKQTAEAAVPTTLDANAFVQRINDIATSVGAKVQSVSPGTPQAYAPPTSIATAQQAAATAAQPAPSASPSPSASASAAPAAPAPAATAPVLAAYDPTITGANFTVVPMTVSVKGTMESTLRFTHKLEHDSRLFLVSGYALSTDGQTGSTVLATLTGYIYTLKR